MRTIAGALLLAVSGSAAAQLGKPFEIEAELTVAPKYVWRGINIVNDWVIQPGVTVSRGGFSLGVWMNFEPTNWNLPNYNQAPRGRVTEMDVTLEYSKSIGVAEASVGVVDYQFPGTGGRRYQEFFGSVGLSHLWGSPELRVFTGSRSGTYATVSVSHELPGTYFGQGGIELDASLSFGDARSNNFYYGSRKTALSDLELTASKSFGFGDRLSLTPAVHFATLLDRSLNAGQPRRSNLWFSISVGAKF